MDAFALSTQLLSRRWCVSVFNFRQKSSYHIPDEHFVSQAVGTSYMDDTGYLISPGLVFTNAVQRSILSLAHIIAQSSSYLVSITYFALTGKGLVVQ